MKDKKQDTSGFLLRELPFRGEHFELEWKVKDYLFSQGLLVDLGVYTMTGEKSVEVPTGEIYYVTKYIENQEISLTNLSQVRRAGELLGELHNRLSHFLELDFKRYQKESADRRMEKRTRQLRRVRQYLKGKGRKDAFEIQALNCFSYFYEQTKVAERWISKWVESPVVLCHGDYNYHNVLATKQGFMIMGFQKLCMGQPMDDVYYFLRKTMEKNTWNAVFGREFLTGYESRREMTENDEIYLMALLTYPEKYQKLMSQYYNRKKTWYSARSEGKLQKVLDMEDQKKEFLDWFQEEYLG